MKPLLAASSWSWHAPYYAGRWSLWNLPAGARALGLDAIEANDFMLPPPRLSRLRRPLLALLPGAPPELWRYSRASLERLRVLVAEQGTELLAWTINSDFTVPAWQWPAQRLYLARGLAAARQLGVRLLRVNLGGSVETPATRDPLIATRLATFVRRSQSSSSGPAITLENHWGVSSDIDRHLRIFDSARAQLAAGEQARLGCCFDPSNMAVAQGAAGEAQRERWWQALAERANHFHLKTAAFDEAGRETTLPHERLWALLETAGYNGAVTIEFQGEGDPAAGVRQSVALFHRLVGEPVT
jgi:sugar phosphate isomerase/epimerase